MTTDSLQQEIEALREKLARLEAQKKRLDDAAWHQYQRERHEAIAQADKQPRLGKRLTS